MWHILSFTAGVCLWKLKSPSDYIDHYGLYCVLNFISIACSFLVYSLKSFKLWQLLATVKNYSCKRFDIFIVARNRIQNERYKTRKNTSNLKHVEHEIGINKLIEQDWQWVRRSVTINVKRICRTKIFNFLKHMNGFITVYRRLQLTCLEKYCIYSCSLKLIFLQRLEVIFNLFSCLIWRTLTGVNPVGLFIDNFFYPCSGVAVSLIWNLFL